MLKALLILLLSLPITTFAQIKYLGTPDIRNFSKSEYNAGTQNWVISQDSNGYIYFANNDGLLSFNGVEWNLTRVSDISPLRSILVDSSNKIYAGLINDFGIINNEDNRASSYRSLKYLVPEKYREFDDIWRIFEVDEGIFFQCYKYIFLYKDNKVQVIEPDKLFRFSYKVGNRVLVHQPGSGLFEYRGGMLELLPWWQKDSVKEISAILESGDNEILVGTTYSGIYVLKDGQLNEWNTPVNEYIKKNRLFSATILPGNYYAFGTILKGLIISDQQGNVVHILDNNAGIQNNTILSLYVDRDENLWLGLDNGIDYIEINSPLSYIGSKRIGTGYCCKVFEGKLYLGTNQGLYVTPFNSFSASRDFELVKNTAGQVWTLEEFDGLLLAGHNNGTYLVKGQSATNICKEEGAWKYLPLKDKPDLLIGGHYQGLVLFKKSNGEWSFYKKIEGFNESSRYLFQDKDGYIWIGHSGKGIFRLRLNVDAGITEDVVQYTDKDGLPSNAGNILFKYREELFVSTNRGIYEYDPRSNLFVESGRMNKVFGASERIKSLYSDDEGNIWYIGDSESGYIRENEDMTYTRVNIPFRKLKKKYVNEFEFIYAYNRNNIIIGLEDGFVHYAPLIPKSYNKEFRAFITKIELPYIDSLLYVRVDESNPGLEFPFSNNSFRFHFAAPFFENEVPLEFSFLLEGFSDKWSNWSDDSYKDFTTLHEGIYTLKLKARNIYGSESLISSLSFRILPPWRRSTTAYLLYLALSGIFVYLVIRFVARRMKLAAIRQEEKYQQEIKEKADLFQREALIAEKEIIDLRNEKLRSEMVYRDKELANQTMAIIEKNKFLKRINEDLNRIQDYVVAEEARNRIYGLVKKIRKEIDIKHQNKIFETYFDEANEGLFRRLKEKHPDLTPYDLRLCAFIRMNISTKEIATILNISYRGAEVGRYRLRKKMQLPREVNLSSYLSSF